MKNNKLYTDDFKRSEFYETVRKEGQARTQKELIIQFGVEYEYISKKAKYRGDMLGGFRHGHGVMVWQNGTNYDGAWHYGFAHGIGKLVDIDGNI